MAKIVTLSQFDSLASVASEPVGKNFSIAVSDWTLENEKYFAIVQDTRLNLNKFADVFFDETCLDTVKDAKISAEIAEVTLRSGSDDMIAYTNVIAIKFTAENLPTDSISGVYYLFEEENYMAKVRLNSCNGSSGGLNSVSISGGDATLQGGNLIIEIDSQTDENFTSAEKLKLNFVENNAQENIIESIYFNGVELPIDAKAVSISSDTRQISNFLANPAAVTLQPFTQEIVTVSSDSPAPWQAYSTDSDLSVSVKDNHVTLKSGASGSNKDVSCNFYQLGTQNFKDAYLDFPVHLVKLDALKGKFTFDDTLADSSGSTDVTWNCNDSANVEFVNGVNGKAVKKKSAGNSFYLTPTGLSIGGRDFTIQFWAKEIEGSQSILDFRCTDTNICFILNHGSSKTNFEIYLTNACVQSINVDADISADFHHYAYVYSHENQTAKFFFDGVCKYTKSELTIPRVAVSSVMLGNSYGNNNAAFDNLEIYDGLALYSDDFTPDR